jgi:predicted RNA-binding protein with PIN domain
MIKKYIVDGNNLIGKISDLWALQQKDRQMSRVKLVRYLDQYFAKKNVKVSLHLDGYAADPIPSSKVKIIYSDNKTADNKIKNEIDISKNPKVIAVVSSDHSVQNYAKVNSCTVVSSEDFAKMLKDQKSKKSEEEIAKSISNDEIKKMFGVD